MPRLLFITTIHRTLGSHIYPLTKHFCSLGWQVDGAAHGVHEHHGALDEYDHLFEITWSRNPFDPRNWVLAIPQLVSLIRNGNYDLVHVHTPVAAFITRLAMRLHMNGNKPKIIYTAHGFHFYSGGSLWKNIAFTSLEKLAGRWTDHLIVINLEDYYAANKYHLVRDNNVHHMPGIGINTDHYAREKVAREEIHSVREEHGLLPGDHLILRVAEFIPRKRHADAIRAFARLERLDVHFILAGSGRLMDRMQELVIKLNCSDNVHFLGRRDDIRTLICASDALILPSEQEGLPVCVLEALSLGVPVVGTDVRGTRELLEGGIGFLVKVRDVDGLANAMRWILDNPEEAKVMGQRGREKARKYELQNILRMHEDLYAQVLGES